ncbi:MAG: APC family permease [Emcibacteraceae bacterium]|nr:APC family permease [Emcibacteraceae bacterium]
MNKITHKRSLGKKDIILFCISAILLLDTLAAGASIGVSSIFWWCLLAVIFFIPFSIISAELSCRYPDQGGIYAWVKRAIGEKWASRVSWYYWVNVAIWCPALYILFVGMLNQLLPFDFPLWVQIAFGIILAWLSVLVNVITLDIGKWVPNLGAIFKSIVFLAIIGGAIQYYLGNGMANPITIETLTPNVRDGFQYLPVIIYGMLGFELVTANADDIQSPEKNIPRGILISGAIIIVFYILATVAILTAIPASEINLVEGLLDTFTLFFGGSALGDIFIMILAIFTLYSFFSNGVTWSLGANRAAAEAALDGDLPKIFALESKTRGTPVGAAVMLGVASTVILVLYGFLANSNEDLFWSLFAFSGVIFMLPYVAMMIAYIKLKRENSDTEISFKAPGPDCFSTLLAVICIVLLVATIILFNYTPEDGLIVPVFTGSVVLILMGELMIKLSPKG